LLLEEFEKGKYKLELNKQKFEIVIHENASKVPAEKILKFINLEIFIFN